MLEEILDQVKRLTPEDRLRLIRCIIDSLLVKPGKITPPRIMVRGQFHGPNMSTPADFGLPEEQGTERLGHGD